ncbi:uncharacterized protein EV420DRAFT_1486519 [Desarmillaria tabescens]|uniref:Uncharacterized protein n=1 Tax=Armillaria tabescens TaxID=1929756 RepID=A0AA39JBC9_ARMTA|nr:uncharacterized protein EV420DRAFT_1486519 [Desarmillaria tabescens]KAK0438867.1 hypothetical protein EV420DRAFT_1486519 [Desarmillaria tabescens]
MVSYSNYSYSLENLDVFKWEGSWELTAYDASSINEVGVMAWTQDLTANVTFTFPAPANAFYYYGIPRCCGALYAICIDCDPESSKFEKINAVNSTDDGKNPPFIKVSDIKKKDQTRAVGIVSTGKLEAT